MQTYVDVAINLPQITDTYHYHIPPDLADLIFPGSLVVVPFGKQRAQGVVLGFVQQPEVSRTRAVEDILDEKPVLTPVQIALARWMANETLSALGTCINLMLPPGLGQRTDTLIRLNPDHEIDFSNLSPIEKRLINLLKKRGDLRGRQVDASIRQVEWRGSLRKLARAGIVHTRAILPPPRVRPKTIRMVTLAVEPDALDQWEAQLSRVGRVHNRRLRVLRLLREEALPIEPSQIYDQTGAKNSDLKVLEEAGYLEIFTTQIWRDPLEDKSYLPTNPPVLTKDQHLAWEKIQSGFSALHTGVTPAPFLLHGVTGSGKTELYLRAVGETLAENRQALVLVPEISLTPQTVRRFLSRFPGKVGVVHSQLSEGERYDTWRRVRNGELSVIVGPRSALFMPLENLGLIVVDECHEESFDQQEITPLYRGVKTAVACARLSGSVIILGSATPRVTQFYAAESGHWTYVGLPKRILAHKDVIMHHLRKQGKSLLDRPVEGEAADLGLPQVTVVDMREELQADNRSIFSRAMQSAIEAVLESGQQGILFLNRRGTATYVFCRDCGYVAKCPHDDKPLTYHRGQAGLFCHTCAYQRKLPTTCPDCGGKQIRHLGTGTEKVQVLLQEHFPGVKTLRWDAETTRAKGAHDRILSKFAEGQADFLIGTQMLAKGLDLPLVTLVGVVLAEVGLNLPDYRATERTFQVLTQVAGRAGRSPLGGRVIIQTYDPDHYVIQTAAHHDFDSFYNKEMAYRLNLKYPPYTRLVRLEYRHFDDHKAEDAARTLGENLRRWIKKESPSTTIIGPAPCFFTKLHGRYRWQIILRGPDPLPLFRNRQLPDWMIEVDPSSLL